MEQSEVSQCGLRIGSWKKWNMTVWTAACVNWNDWKWSVDALEWSGKETNKCQEIRSKC